MGSFYFVGRGPLSKSLLNRAWIVKSWFPEFEIEGMSQCEDILLIKKAVEDIQRGKTEFDCGLSGSAFRFLALRLSREPGQFLLKGRPALLRRPLQNILPLCSQLSVEMEKLEGGGFAIKSKGWRPQGDCIHVPSQTTSQHASSLVLNSWKLNRDLYFSIAKDSPSLAYFKMTVHFMRRLGFVIKENGEEYYIPKGQQSLKVSRFRPEQDKSCLFALAAFSVLGGKAVFLDWEEESLQPDSYFPFILKEMGVKIVLHDDERKEGKSRRLEVHQSPFLKPLRVDLKDRPDLFPLLAVLCARAEGVSQLSGLSHQAFKESNRMDKIRELLDKCQIKTWIKSSGRSGKPGEQGEQGRTGEQGTPEESGKSEELFIQGKKAWPRLPSFEFSAAEDHRIAMAGDLIRFLGVPIVLKGREAMGKSFPELIPLLEKPSS